MNTLLDFMKIKNQLMIPKKTSSLKRTMIIQILVKPIGLKNPKLILLLKVEKN